MSEVGSRPSHVGALDGVRGVAVLLVLLFHLGVAGFGSGFLGVDVFFVLSGFLITTLLLAEIEKTGRVAVTAFWARRVRRLMPAVIVLLFTVALVTHATATFSQRTSMRGDLLAAATYVANWHFIATSSYFSNTGAISPLQHTWSLGIEEQFYLAWPLMLALLAAVTRRPRRTVLLLALIGAALSAVALALLWNPDSVERAYMGTDARIFEPLIGAVGAALVAMPRGRALVDRWGRPLAAAGAAGVAGALMLIHADTSRYYLGGAAALSIFTLMLVASTWVGRGGVLRRGLEWRPLAWLGVISYGVYLWHWPLLVWLGVPGARGAARVRLGALGFVLTIGVATCSYYLIERPIRTGWSGARHRAVREAWQRRVVLISAPAVIAVVALTSVAATAVPPPPPGVPVIMLTGDSVPLRLEAALEQAAAGVGWRIVSAASGGCPVSGEPHILTYDTDRESTKCPRVPVAQDALIAQTHPDIVIWWDRWSLSSFLTPQGKQVASGSARFWRLRAVALERNVDRLTRSGALVVFVATEPPGEGMLSRCSPEHCNSWVRFQIDHYADVTTTWNALMHAYAQRHPGRAAFISVTDVVCRSDRTLCDDLVGGVPARPDGTHYTGPGEAKVTAALMRLLRPLVTRAVS